MKRRLVLPEERRAYSIWRQMRARCERVTSPDYENYGGRGIRVCDRWQSFDNFLADMGCPPDGTTLDREKNDCGYEPGNCRWATPTTQNRNRRDNRILEFMGVQRCVAEWAQICCIESRTIRRRIDVMGWTVEKALTTPIGEEIARKLDDFHIAKAKTLLASGSSMRAAAHAVGVTGKGLKNALERRNANAHERR